MPSCADAQSPRYLPHMAGADILRMGLTPLGEVPWIETDSDIGRYHRHKLAQRERFGSAVYQSTPDSLHAQRELAAALCDHLLRDHARDYRAEGDHLYCLPGGFSVPREHLTEPLWQSSLWIADDLVIMEKLGGEYRLTAASLCSPSDWQLADKFGRSLADIHAPIPGFAVRLTPPVHRFFEQLGPGTRFARFNWALQADNELAKWPGDKAPVEPGTPLYYRVERQTLVRLPASGAVAFTIRVYLSPLESLARAGDALRALLLAVDATPPALAHYKGFDRLLPALEKYRAGECRPDPP